jgi:hypothetical protein
MAEQKTHVQGIEPARHLFGHYTCRCGARKLLSEWCRGDNETNGFNLMMTSTRT